ncbi:MAG: class I SAM-dependent methyltransferase [Kofleriaceae bacterium]
MRGYDDIEIGGTDTAAPLALAARLALMERMVPLTGRIVLDAGCGAGGYLRALRARGVEAFGLEYSAAKVAAYQADGGEPTWIQVGDLRATPYPDGRFDVVLLNEVLEHVPDERAALRELYRVLRPGGHLLVFSPNRLYPLETHGVTLRATGRAIVPSRALGVPYLPLSLGRRLFHYPARNYWPWELRRLLAEVGFEIATTTYQWQTFENISASQPGWMRPVVPLLRRIARVAERLPTVRALGVSQVVLARRA